MVLFVKGTKRKAGLEGFCGFCDTSYKEVMVHSLSYWLSFKQAMLHTSQYLGGGFQVLKEYFQIP